MIGEVTNITRSGDRYRMLCQGMASLRVAHELTEPVKGLVIVIMAVYVTDRLIAERYLLYMPRQKDRHVRGPVGMRTRKLTKAPRWTFFARISI